MTESKRLSNRSTGQFSFQNWLQEGDGLFASSRETRKNWKEHRQKFSKKISDGDAIHSPRESDDWSLLTGLPRSSMLLLGYAVEMYFKGAMAKAYRGCSNEMFERDLKGRFKHNFVQMAGEVAFPLEASDVESLNKLKDMVLVDARYPVFVREGETYSDTVNQQTSRIWSAEFYTSLTELVERVRSHSMKIDSDEKNPASFYAVGIDHDGYLSFRVGGRLPPRITYKLSTIMRENGKTTATDVRALFVVANLYDKRLLHYWDRAIIFEDGKKTDGSPKTIRLQPPPPLS
ncbi:MAG: hypothetical protein O3A08_00465 [Proteobacteria bacterium]|nr:hypothetical protein [Pseudomonadota bacterium]MDA1284906.1 hypothetical protein [Pseudomonadota bacterium]